MKEISNKEYDSMVKKASPDSTIVKDCINAFIFGGILCTIGQVIMNVSMNYGFTKMQASTLTSILLILLSAVLTGVGVYDYIAKYAGAGTLVPITGFANSIVSPAMEFKSEGLVLGMAAKMFVLAGPVLVYGTTASIISGVIVYIIEMLGGTAFGG